MPSPQYSIINKLTIAGSLTINCHDAEQDFQVLLNFP